MQQELDILAFSSQPDAIVQRCKAVVRRIIRGCRLQVLVNGPSVCDSRTPTATMELASPTTTLAEPYTRSKETESPLPPPSSLVKPQSQSPRYELGTESMLHVVADELNYPEVSPTHKASHAGYGPSELMSSNPADVPKVTPLHLLQDQSDFVDCHFCMKRVETKVKRPPSRMTQ